MSKKISVIIPAYNAQNTVLRAINSVCENAYGNIEIIVVNDGSTDDTAKVVEHKQREDKRIILLNQENAGVSHARNNGIQAATGEILMFLDADDAYSSCYCGKIAEAFEKEQTDIVLSGYNEIYKNNTIQRQCPILGTVEKESIFSDIIEPFYFSGKYKFMGSVWLAGFKRKLITDHKVRFHEKVKRAEDTLFLVSSLMCAERVSLIEGCYYHYNLADSTATKKYSSYLCRNNEILSDEWKALFKKHGYEYTAEYAGNAAVANVFSILVNEARDGNPNSFLQQIKAAFKANEFYKNDLKKSRPLSSKGKVKKYIAKSQILCAMFYIVRRVQRTFGVEF